MWYGWASHQMHICRHLAPRVPVTVIWTEYTFCTFLFSSSPRMALMEVLTSYRLSPKVHWHLQVWSPWHGLHPQITNNVQTTCLILCWSPSCQQNSSDLPRYGLHKSSVGVLCYLAQRLHGSDLFPSAVDQVEIGEIWRPIQHYSSYSWTNFLWGTTHYPAKKFHCHYGHCHELNLQQVCTCQSNIYMTAGPKSPQQNTPLWATFSRY